MMSSDDVIGSPSFREIPTVDEPPRDPIPAVGRGDDEESEEEEFEFAFVSDSGATTADEIFSNGQIRPIYPVFDRDLLLMSSDPSKIDDPVETLRAPLRKLLIEDREPPSSSSSDADELEGLPIESYCVWTPRSSVPPSPDRCKKSNSTGSSKRWRLRDLVIGRSSSDGREKFVFLSAAPQSQPATKAGEANDEKGKAVKSGGAKKKKVAAFTAAHQMHYGGGAGDRRRSYLPYREGIVGFFANVNGVSKSYHPM
ncbi:hypothetical protein QJS10_CPB14g00120 [Acorus calamus]|uniref:Uncharacterized protein n=1 Tax=Acorus calamus TaxID=4465 RepID=A0AAV9DGU5_ACOCL|nr:hypothetical protein QJS10_CPB14g00120 [Acorus calamus]